jgi:hypothetical protein
VQPCDLGRLANSGQVDCPVPREEQADVAIDREPGVVAEPDAQCVETPIERARVRRRKGWEVLDARRERFSLTAQALLLWMCPPPSVRAAPGVVISRTAGWVGLP